MGHYVHLDAPDDTIGIRALREIADQFELRLALERFVLERVAGSLSVEPLRLRRFRPVSVVSAAATAVGSAAGSGWVSAVTCGSTALPGESWEQAAGTKPKRARRST